MDGINAAELIVIANLLAALVRDADVLSELIERHVRLRRERDKTKAVVATLPV